jgi:hypothetical protein
VVSSPKLGQLFLLLRAFTVGGWVPHRELWNFLASGTVQVTNSADALLADGSVSPVLSVQVRYETERQFVICVVFASTLLFVVYLV